jgi:hypothetical protein
MRDARDNNAGILSFNQLERTSRVEYLRTVEVNQVGVFLGMRAVVADLRSAGGGAIVNLSSVEGLGGMPYLCAYTASKFAVRGMTKSAALELAGDGIRVNYVHPGGIDTPMVRAFTGDGPDDLDAIAEQVAMRRAGRTPARIAEQLGVDELLVRAWVEDVGPRRSHHTTRGGDHEAETASRSTTTMAPADRAALAAAQASHPSQAGRQLARAQGDEQHRTAYELARATARDEARRRHLADPAFAGGIGLVTGVAEIDPHAVTITTVDAGIAAAALRWLRAQLEIDPNRIRLVLRIGPRVAGDLAAHRWSRDLDVPRDSVAVASWRQAPGDDAEQVLLRIADPTVAATVAGWRDALLAPPGDDPADIAF